MKWICDDRSSSNCRIFVNAESLKNAEGIVDYLIRKTGMLDDEIDDYQITLVKLAND